MARDRAARAEAKPLRLFVAVEVPDHVREVVAQSLAPFEAEFPEARWVPLENWHVSVKFLGRTWPRLHSWVEDRVADVARSHERFTVRIHGLGAFPSPSRARVVWAGIEDRSARLAELALGLDAALASEFEPETRAFRPHLTVARSDPPLALPASFAAAEASSEPFAVERIVLFRSHLRRPAPVYEPLADFPLG